MARTGNPYNLSDKHWRFVQEYLVDVNPTAAYKRAGYKGLGHSAEVSAEQILKKLEVSAAIKTEQAKRGARVQLTQDAVLEEIHLLSHSNIEDYRIDDQGNLALAPGVHTRAMRAVASLKKRIIHTEVGMIYETELKLWNKPASVKMAGDHLGTFDRVVVESSTIQAAHTAREAALAQVRAQLQLIRARHQQAEGVVP